MSLNDDDTNDDDDDVLVKIQLRISKITVLRAGNF